MLETHDASGDVFFYCSWVDGGGGDDGYLKTACSGNEDSAGGSAGSVVVAGAALARIPFAPNG